MVLDGVVNQEYALTAASGDQCDTIATRYSISLADFYSWNPAAGRSCQSLWLDYYIYVGH